MPQPHSVECCCDWNIILNLKEGVQSQSRDYTWKFPDGLMNFPTKLQWLQSVSRRSLKSWVSVPFPLCQLARSFWILDWENVLTYRRYTFESVFAFLEETDKIFSLNKSINSRHYQLSCLRSQRPLGPTEYFILLDGNRIQSPKMHVSNKKQDDG
jgi:hypothetical protein